MGCTALIEINLICSSNALGSEPKPDFLPLGAKLVASQTPRKGGFLLVCMHPLIKYQFAHTVTVHTVTAYIPIPREGSTISEGWHSPAGLASQDPCSGTSLTPPTHTQVSDVLDSSTTSFTAFYQNVWACCLCFKNPCFLYQPFSGKSISASCLWASLWGLQHPIQSSGKEGKKSTDGRGP